MKKIFLAISLFAITAVSFAQSVTFHFTNDSLYVSEDTLSFGTLFFDDRVNRHCLILGDNNTNNGAFFGSILAGELSTIDNNVGDALNVAEAGWIRAYGGKSLGRGAMLGDVVNLGVPNGSITSTAQYTAWVSATNTVTIRLATKSTEDPASGTFKVTVTK